MNNLHGMRWGLVGLALVVGPVSAYGQEAGGRGANDGQAGGAAARAGQQSSDPGLPAPPAASEVEQDAAGAAAARRDAGEAGSDTDGQTAGGGAADLERELRDLRESNELLIREVDTLRREVRQLHDRMGELATGGGSGSGGGGEAAPRNLLGQMAVDEDFRRDVMRAIQGEVVINNRTAVTQPFYVNGVLWNVPPGRYVVPVPLGDVTAHLPDEPPQEFSNRWRLDRDPQTNEPRRYRLWLSIGYPPASVEPIPESGEVARR